jgi:hypothetical protein
MKNIPTFENFLNEANSFKVTDFPVDAIVHFKDGEAWKVVKPSGMSGLFNRRRSADEITIKPDNDLAKKKNVSLPINVDLNYLNANVTKIDESLCESSLNEGKSLRAMVLSVGVINMTTGATMFGWSIFENKGMYAFLTSGSYLLLATKDSFKKGDEVELIGNDTNRRLGKKHTIVDMSEATKDDLLKMLKSHDYDYYPLRAFKARPANNRKLITSYSVKGIE